MNQEYQQTIALFVVSSVAVLIALYMLFKFGYTKPKEREREK